MNTASRNIRIAMATTMIFTAAASVQAAIIGVDNRNGMSEHNVLYRGFAYESFRNILTRAGHTLVPMNNFEAADFAGLDAVISKSRYGGWTTAEADAFENFVLGGGGLLFSSDGSGSAAVVNNVATRFGVTFSGALTYGTGLTVSGFVNHPLTEGITALGIDYQRAISSFSGDAIDLTTGDGTQNILGVNGKAVFLSDMSMFSTYSSDRALTFRDNAQLAENIVDYITVPEPSSAALLFVTGAFVFYFRMRVRR